MQLRPTSSPSGLPAVGQTVHARDADGIGLGLPLTRRIVELHGGELDFLHDAGSMTAMIRMPHWRKIGSAQ